jgi:hypothetical protein
MCTGARRVSNLSEEQRNKKRENDRIAQQNIRRRNKELIEKLQHEVDVLRKLKQVDVAANLMRQNKMLQDEVRALRKTLYLQTGRTYPASGPSCLQPRFPGPPLTLSGSGLEADGLPSGGHASDYTVPNTTFGSPYLGATNPYDQWPSNVVPVPSTVTVNSVESSPGASGAGEDLTPAYVHTSLPMMDGPVMAGNTSVPSIGSGSKGDYQELPDGGKGGAGLHGGGGGGGDSSFRAWNPLADRVRCPAGSSTNSFPGASMHPHSSSGYMHEPPWQAYSNGPYYPQATAL